MTYTTGSLITFVENALSPAECPESDTMAKAMELIDDDYRAELHRTVHADAAFEVVLQHGGCW